MLDVTATFPARFCYSRFTPYLSNQVRDVGRAITGAESIVPTFAARWKFSTRIFVREEAERLEWFAFSADMQEGIGVTELPVFAQYRPLDASGNQLPRTVKPSISTFGHWQITTNTDEFVRLAVDAEAGATELFLNLIDCLGLRPGHLLSIGSRLHCVVKSSDVGATVKIIPPLREGHVAGDPVEVANPTCLARMIGESNGVPMTEPRPVNIVEPVFTEAF